MSINLYLFAKVRATLKLYKEQRTVVEHFDLRQTPTAVTLSIMDNRTNDKIKDAYVAWLENEITALNKDTDTKEYIDAKTILDDHISNLNQFIEEHKDWIIVWEHR